jgi:hypothetical protein
MFIRTVFMSSVARTAGMVLVMALAPTVGKAAVKLARKGTIRACASIANASKSVHHTAVSVGSRLEQ